MSGEYVFLNYNSYMKDDQRRCYAMFADCQGNVTNFNAAAIPDSVFPDAFSICDVDFQLQQYGKSSAFILESIKPKGTLEVKK